MRATILHSAEAFVALAARWDALASASDAGLFLSHRWLSAWWRAFHGVDELWVFIVEDDDGRWSPPGPSACARRDWARCAWPSCASSAISAARPPRDVHRSILVRPGREAAACEHLIDRADGRARLGRARRAVDRGASSARRWSAPLAAAGVKFDRRRSLGRAYVELPARRRLGRVRAHARAATIGRRRRLRHGRRSTSCTGWRSSCASCARSGRPASRRRRRPIRRPSRFCTRWCRSCTPRASCASASSASKGRAHRRRSPWSPTASTRCSSSAAPIPSTRGRRLRAAHLRLHRGGRPRAARAASSSPTRTDRGTRPARA